jgi:hypothetical protein
VLRDASVADRCSRSVHPSVLSGRRD